MSIYSIIRLTPEYESFEIQKTNLEKYITLNNIKIDTILEVNGKNDKSYFYNLEKALEKVSINDTIIVNDLSVFGQSIFSILRYLEKLNLKNIMLHIINLNQILSKNQDTKFFILLSNLLKIERNKIKQRTNLAKNTREKKGTTLGRKSGKPTKSMYDEHKVKIKRLYDLGVSKKKILDHIGVGTAQSLGVYIKKKFPEEKKPSTVQKNVQIKEKKDNNVSKNFTHNFKDKLMKSHKKGKYKLKKATVTITANP